MEFKVGGTIYLLQFKTAQDSSINRILSTAHTVVSVGIDRVLVESCDKKLIILYADDIKPYLDYARNTYGRDFYTQYDTDRPSWMSH